MTLRFVIRQCLDKFFWFTMVYSGTQFSVK
jgi:hypothetical protein